MTKIIRDDVTLKKIYADNDLAEWELFKGNFINFGYWKSIELRDISEAKRTLASKQLYNLVKSNLELTKNDTCIEIGCGKGVGSLEMAREGCSVFAIDLFSEQVDRAKNIHQHEIEEKKLNLTFQQGSSSSLPFRNNQFSKLYSVEAVQHFPSLIDFTNEAHRVLKPNAKLLLTTYFLSDKSHLHEVKNLIPWIGCEFEPGHAIPEVKAALIDAGFANVISEPIGDFVWEGMDAWMTQTEHKGEPERNYLRAYKNKWLDYYMISAIKP